MYKRFASMVGEAGELREVAPRRYIGAEGATHVISAAAIKHAVDAGLLHQVRVRSYKFASQPSV